jgi:mycobactin peptide synthetase MbtE
MESNTIQERLNVSFSKYRDRIAIESGIGQLTYGELDYMSNDVACQIIHSGIKEGTIIGVFMRDRLELIAIISGILKARCLFVPLDPLLPLPRVTNLMKIINLEYLFTSNQNYDNTFKNQGIKNLYPEERLGRSADRPRSEYGENDPIYIYFTSGSSGS